MKSFFWPIIVSLFTFSTGATQGHPPPLEFLAEVIKVIDGDRLRVKPLGLEQQKLIEVQLIGLDAPEASSREYTGQEPQGTRARQYLSLLCTRTVVRLELDVQTNLPDGTLLAYAWQDSILLNEKMLQAGWAMLVTEPPNVQYSERLQAALKEGQREKTGIWSDAWGLNQSPSEFRRIHAEQEETEYQLEQRLSIPEFQEECIIGNRKTKKYHTTKSRFYESAKESRHRIFFPSEENAEKAGYQKSK